MNWSEWTVGRYAYKIDHTLRILLIVSIAANVILALTVSALIGLLGVWK